MRKKFTIAILIAMALLMLGGCGKNASSDDSAVASIPAGSISNEENEFTKKLLPLERKGGEDVESEYFRHVVQDGAIYYEVHVEGDEETTLIPVETAVVYTVETDDEVELVKAKFDYTDEATGETTSIEQYRIFATFDQSAISNVGQPDSSQPDASQPDVSTGAASSGGLQDTDGGIFPVEEGQEAPAD